MVVAGRLLENGDVAVMMVEAGAQKMRGVIMKRAHQK